MPTNFLSAGLVVNVYQLGLHCFGRSPQATADKALHAGQLILLWADLFLAAEAENKAPVVVYM